MSTKQILLGFLPWIAFSAISTRVGPGAAGAAALVAFVVAAALLARSYIRGESPKLLELTALVTFAGIGLWALLDPGAADVLAFYGRGGATLLLAVVIAVSLLGRPFTEQYARESVPREYWDSPRFHAINRRISAAWAGTVAVMGVGHLLAGWLAAATGTVAGPADLVLNWLVPGLLIVLTVNYTRRVTAGADAPQAAR